MRVVVAFLPAAFARVLGRADGGGGDEGIRRKEKGERSYFDENQLTGGVRSGGID